MRDRSVIYEETQCKGALNRVEGMRFKWSLNPYQGCPHGCHYCYARRYYEYLDLDPSLDFDRRVYVKTNIEEVLREELRRPGWKFEEVAVGTATDPYQPVEGRYKITRSCLSAFLEYGNPVNLVTKGTLILRDREILRELSEGPGVVVSFSLVTLDTELWKQMEPGTPPPLSRLRVMESLVRSGISAGVLAAPVIPGVSDSIPQLQELLKAAADHGASFVGCQPLYLKGATKGHFLNFLGREFPSIREDYPKMYQGAYLKRGEKERLEALVQTLREEVGLLPPPESLPSPVQQLRMEF